MQTANESAFSISEALRFAWDVLKKHLNPLVMFGAAGAFLAALNSGLQRAGTLGGALAIAVQVAQWMLMFVLLRVALRLHDQQPVEFLREPGKALQGFGSFFVTGLLYALIVTGGLVLLIVPGIYWALKFGLAPLLTVDSGREPLEALKESAALTRGLKWKLFEFWLALVGINLLGLLALGVGVIFTMPLSVVAGTWVYRRIRARGPQEVAQTPVMPTPKLV